MEKGRMDTCLKKDDPRDKENYRPVTVLSAVDKIFEQLISKQITSQFESRLSDCITAYRKSHSSETTLVSLVEQWKLARDGHQCVAVLSTDMSKAFDSLHPRLMLNKLRAYGFEENTVNLLRSVAHLNIRSVDDIRGGRSVAVDDEEKANLMNTYFSSIGEKLARSVEPLPLRPIIEEAVPRLSDIPLSCSIIEKKLSSLKPSKATGPDGISPKLLKLAGPSVAAPLTNLYVRSMDQGVYNDWKIARLNPVFKKDDETEIGNYRPISLLSVPSKILESCVSDALVKHVLLDNRLLTNNQWAYVYRKGYSTELLLAHLTETWRRAIDSKKVVGVVFIDF
ncbi:hypothetical protein ACROYT_G028008 [Oculina patagonica]